MDSPMQLALIHAWLLGLAELSGYLNTGMMPPWNLVMVASMFLTIPMVLEADQPGVHPERPGVHGIAGGWGKFTFGSVPAGLLFFFFERWYTGREGQSEGSLLAQEKFLAERDKPLASSVSDWPGQGDPFEKREIRLSSVATVSV
jgi:hypothetical protein